MAYLDRITKNASFDDINHKMSLTGLTKMAGSIWLSGVSMRILSLSIAALLVAGSPALAQDVGAPGQLSGQLPAVADAPPVELDDPLAAFRKAATPSPTDGTVARALTPQEVQATSGTGAPAAPTPTAGGFQQQGEGQLPPLDAAFDIDVAPSIEEQEAELLQKAKENAFDSALNGMMPLTPSQIRMMLDKYRVTREASEERIGGVPTPEITVQTISMEPGTAPPVIKLSPGHVTSLTMLDMTGQPWPVQDVSWGGNFEIISPNEGGHVIRISPMGAHEVGNMSVQMIGLKTPVTFMLQTQLEVVQYRFDAMIPEYGPMAKPPLIENGAPTLEAGSDKTLMRILDGTPPAGAKKMMVSGVDGRTSVYTVGGITYLRTPLTLLSPGWDASVKSADGMTVYAVHHSPVMLLSDRGRMVRAVVQDSKVVQ